MVGVVHWAVVSSATSHLLQDINYGGVVYPEGGEMRPEESGSPSGGPGRSSG